METTPTNEGLHKTPRHIKMIGLKSKSKKEQRSSVVWVISKSYNTNNSKKRKLKNTEEIKKQKYLFIA